MKTSIKINDQYIQKILLGSTPVQRIYQSGSIVYEAGGSTTPCFEVVSTISQASGDYVDVYAWDTKKWYKKNNLSKYEEYGIMPTVDSLTGLTTYTGKLVILSTDSHEYKWNGSQWVDLGEISDVYTEYEYVQGNGTSYIFTDYVPKENTVAELDVQGRIASSGSTSDGEANIFGSLHQTGSSASKRFTFMYPGYNTDGIAGGIRLEVEGQQLAYHGNEIISRNTVKLDKNAAYINGKKVATFDGSFTGNQAYIGIFNKHAYNPSGTDPSHGLPYAGKIYSVKLYEGDTLVRNYLPATKDGIVGFYDTVNHVMWGSYVSTPLTVGGLSSEQGNIPEEYPTKVAPANNVHYNTLEELELMECPWNGMQATVGQDYEHYLYMNNQWYKLEMPCFEVVSTISEASGDYVDVYVKGESKWYKRNNLSQYEEYGVMQTVKDLSSTTYYTGKLVILSTDSHEYKWNGSEWEDLGNAGSITSYLFADPITSSKYSCSYNPKYYFDNNYKLQILFYLTEGYSYSSDFNMLGSNGTSPIELSWYSNGFYFDSHYPKSTAGEFNTGDYDKRVMADGQLNSHKGKLLLLEIMLNKAVLYDYETGTQLYSSGSIVTKDFKDCGTVLRIIAILRMNANSPAHIGWLKVFDNNGVVVNDIRPALDSNDKLIWHDSIVNADYMSNNSNSFPYHTEYIGKINPPVDYDEKVAPADNVHYDTLLELEMMECPWNGMQATVGNDYEHYLYLDNQWNKLGMPCFEAVNTISEASGDYVDVYVFNTKKWYKKNNINKYEEYGVIHTLSDLSGVTTYTGKLVILSTDRHEYKWNGSEWIDLGECSGSGTPTGYNLPEFAFNYNVKNMSGNAFVNLSAGTEGNSNAIPSSVFTKYNDYITLNSAALVEIPNTSGKLNRTNSDPTFTVIMKVKPTATSTANLLCNRSLNYNWMVRPYSSKYTLHGTSETGSISVSNSTPNIVASVVGSDRTIKYYNITNGTTSQKSSFYYGDTTSSNVTLFSGYQNKSEENYYGDLYWVYVSKLALTQEQINDVVSLNENWTAFEPVEDYTPKAAPPNDVHYDTLVELLISECPYIGMTATVGQDYTVYVYTENGWVIGDVPLDLPYLRFTATENTEITFSQNGLEYSINGGAWKTMTANIAALVPASSYIVFRGECKPTSSNGIGTFSATGGFNVSGNIMSLLFGNDFTDKVSLAGKDYAFLNLFLNNTKLYDATNLVMPATTLSQYCYRSFFKGCTSLKAVNSNLLPATTLASNCYHTMFHSCSSLTASPLLPATNLAPYCYYTMFQECKLSKLPELPATKMVEHCYDTMFNYVDANIPDNYLPSTQLAPYCYTAMFANSFYRTKAMSILPATTLASRCYDTMFINNFNITEAPILPAETLVDNCYSYMLYGCSELSKVVAKFTTTPSSSYTYNWLSNNTATFYKNPNATWDQTISRGSSTVPDNWTITDIPTANYLKFTTVDDNGSTYAFSKEGLEYSIDGGEWTTLSANTNTPNVPKDSNIRFRGYLTPNGSEGIGTFSSSGKFDAEGELMTLLYGEYYVGQTSKYANYMFSELFMNSKVVDATNLVIPNAMGDYYYNKMFYSCTSLTSTPSLPFSHVGYYSCRDMFSGCTSLITIQPMTIGGNSTGAMYYMFSGCTSLVDASMITITNEQWDVCQSMFFKCTSLRKSPIIKGDMKQSSCRNMFYICPSIEEVVYLGTTSPNSINSDSWLYNVPDTGTFYMNKNATWDSTVSRDAHGVPAGWTIVKVDPNDY